MPRNCNVSEKESRLTMIFDRFRKASSRSFAITMTTMAATFGLPSLLLCVNRSDGLLY